MMMMMIVVVWVESPPAGSPKLKTVPKLCKNCLHLMPDISGGIPLLFGGIQRKCQHVDMIWNHMIRWDHIMILQHIIWSDMIWNDIIWYQIQYRISCYLIWYEPFMTSSPTNLGDLWKTCTGLQEWAAVLCHKKLHPIISEALIMTHGTSQNALEILMFIWFWDMARS